MEYPNRWWIHGKGTRSTCWSEHSITNSPTATASVSFSWCRSTPSSRRPMPEIMTHGGETDVPLLFTNRRLDRTASGRWPRLGCIREGTGSCPNGCRSKGREGPGQILDKCRARKRNRPENGFEKGIFGPWFFASGEARTRTTRETTGKTGPSGQSGADSGALDAREAPLDADLAALVDVWPALPAAIKAGILAMIRATGGNC